MTDKPAQSAMIMTGLASHSSTFLRQISRYDRQTGPVRYDRDRTRIELEHTSSTSQPGKADQLGGGDGLGGVRQMEACIEDRQAPSKDYVDNKDDFGSNAARIRREATKVALGQLG